MRLLSCLVCIGVSLNLGLAQQASAQDSEARLVTYIEVDPAAIERATGLLESYAESSTGVRGNRLFQVAQRIGRINHFVVVEVWDNMDARTSHAQSVSVTEFHDAIEPLLISPLDMREHNDLLSAASSSVGSGGVIVVTHVDVFPPFAETLVELMNELVAASRAEHGNAQFDVWVISERANHMTVIEAWDSSAARQLHVTSPHTQEFRSSLVSMIGALYDERLYRML